MRRGLWVLGLACLGAVAWGQGRLRTMPGFAEHQAAQEALAGAMPSLARANGEWDEDGKYRYAFGGKKLVYDAATNKVTGDGAALQPLAGPEPTRSFGPFQNPGRGRQATSVRSKDGKVAQYRAGNVAVTLPGGETVAVTSDGSVAGRLKYGTASWVYGEELGQKDAMGFSPDGKLLWYYRFDERLVPDSHVLTSLLSPQSTLNLEAYPKPGQPNPVVDLFVFDTARRTTAQVPVRKGAFDDEVGHYVYGITWRPDGQALLFHRMDRRQSTLELCSYDPATSAVQVVYRESNHRGWVEFGPLTSLVPDPFVLGPTKLLTLSEDTGYMNVVQVDLEHGTWKALTKLGADVLEVLRVDPHRGTMDYMAADGAEPYRPQLHRVNLDGTGDVRITDPASGHSVDVSPDGKLVVDCAFSADRAPSLRVIDLEGRVKAQLATSEVAGYMGAGFSPAELFSFPSLDGKTTLYGYLHRPRNFDPGRSYPVLFDVYGGPLPPSWGAPRMDWKPGRSQANYGFLVVEVFGRGGQARGRAFRQAIYRNLGGVEVDDMAAAVIELRKRPYVDGSAVGIHGTSYGGYSSAMALLRYPDLFQAAACSSMVSDWRNYDTAYTERYMGLLPKDKESYDKSSALTYAGNLKGWLMVYFGTADDNTHMANSLQFIEALRRKGKSFEVQVGVDRGHSGLNDERSMEFFIERLVMGKR